MAYFKYIHFDRFESMRRGRIRFTQPGAFNDPFEMPAFKAREAQKLRDDILSGLTEQTNDILSGLMRGVIPDAAMRLPMNYWANATSPPEDEAAERRAPSEQAIEKLAGIDKTFGILSLSKSADNLLLWAHYADDHRGLAIEIDPAEQAFDHHAGDADKFERSADVRYSEIRPRIPETDEILFEHFFVKSPEWAYENEYRIVRKFESAVETLDAAAQFPIHLYELPAAAIRKIIFGARVLADQRQTVMNTIKADESFGHVAFAQAKIDPAAFQLDIVDVEANDAAVRP